MKVQRVEHMQAAVVHRVYSSTEIEQEVILAGLLMRTVE